MSNQPDASRGRRRFAKRQPRVTFVGVLGELFITVGLLVLAFLGWQVWLGNLIQGSEQQSVAEELRQTWDKGEALVPAPTPTADPADAKPATIKEPAYGVQFANMIIPRLGDDYERPIGEGVGAADVLTQGVGHYPGTQMPGEIGNAAFAAHRTGYGSPFFDIDKLRVGDSIYIESKAGWYQYKMRGLEYVPATAVEVLSAVPQAPEASATERILTLTSCNPVYTASERIIVYAGFEAWFPRDGGAPPELVALKQKDA